MAKFYGKVGYAAEQTEVRPGIWKDTIVERNYSGDIIKNMNRWNTSSEGINDNVTLNNQISIIADPYANLNVHKMRYVEFMGSLWKITNVDATQRPRLILTVGGVYNSEQT